MQNYKIKVTPETSEEVQKLFFELGCKWSDSGKIVSNLNSKHIYSNGGERIVYGDSNEIFNESKNQEITLPQLRDLVVLKRGSKEMTWQDAFRAKVEGKEVEIFIGGKWLAMNDYSHNKFRLKPQTTHLNGNYTKEELLKIAGDME